jgi:hypothetical protein
MILAVQSLEKHAAHGPVGAGGVIATQDTIGLDSSFDPFYCARPQLDLVIQLLQGWSLTTPS